MYGLDALHTQFSNTTKYKFQDQTFWSDQCKQMIQTIDDVLIKKKVQSKCV